MSAGYEERMPEYREAGDGGPRIGGSRGSTPHDPSVGEEYIPEHDEDSMSRGCQSSVDSKVPKYKTSRFTGVSFNKRSQIKPWKAEIRVNSQKVYLGSFASEEEAAQAYAKASKEKEKEKIRTGRTHQYRVVANRPDNEEEYPVAENYPPPTNGTRGVMVPTMMEGYYYSDGRPYEDPRVQYGGGYDSYGRDAPARRRGREEHEAGGYVMPRHQMAPGAAGEEYWGGQEPMYDRLLDEVTVARDRYAVSLEAPQGYDPHPSEAAAAPSFPCASSSSSSSLLRSRPADPSTSQPQQPRKRRAYDMMMEAGLTTQEGGMIKEEEEAMYLHSSKRRVEPEGTDHEKSSSSLFSEGAAAGTREGGEGGMAAAAEPTSPSCSPHRPSSPQSPPTGEGAAAFTLSRLSLSTQSMSADSSSRQDPLPAAASARAPPHPAMLDKREKMVSCLRKEFWTCLLDNNANVMALLRKAIDGVESGWFDYLLEGASGVDGTLDLNDTTNKDSLLAKIMSHVQQAPMDGSSSSSSTTTTTTTTTTTGATTTVQVKEQVEA